jgi:hypothetical protein
MGPWRLVAGLLGTVPLIWYAAVLLQRLCVSKTTRWYFFKRINQELRPFVIPAALPGWAILWHYGFWNRVSVIMQIYVWVMDVYRYRDDDDDPWRRRGRQLREKLTVKRPVPVEVQ